MLSDFYTEEITIKYNGSGSPYDGYTYSTKYISGAVQNKRKKVIDINGDEVISESTLFTNEKLNIEDIIVYNNRDRKIISCDVIRDHFGDGSIDHYEYQF